MGAAGTTDEEEEEEEEEAAIGCDQMESSEAEATVAAVVAEASMIGRREFAAANTANSAGLTTRARSICASKLAAICSFASALLDAAVTV